MISQIQIARSDKREMEHFSDEEYMAEKEVRTLIEEIIRETNISELCCKEGIDARTYHKWSKDFLDVTRKKLLKDDLNINVESAAQNLKNENIILAKLVAELSAEVQLLREELARTR